jgi:hypothetical protein
LNFLTLNESRTVAILCPTILLSILSRTPDASEFMLATLKPTVNISLRCAGKMPRRRKSYRIDASLHHRTSMSDFCKLAGECVCDQGYDQTMEKLTTTDMDVQYDCNLKPIWTKPKLGWTELRAKVPAWTEATRMDRVTQVPYRYDL